MILLNTRDYVNLVKRIQYYASSRLVSTIIVPWCNKDYPAPRDTLIGRTMVYFVLPSKDHSKSDQLSIVIDDIRIASDAVLIASDDYDVRHEDITMMYQVWNNYPRNIVRLLSQSNHVHSAFNSSVERKYFQLDSINLKEKHVGYGFDFDSAKVIMSSSDFLSVFLCSDRKLLSDRMINIITRTLL